MNTIIDFIGTAIVLIVSLYFIRGGIGIAIWAWKNNIN